RDSRRREQTRSQVLLAGIPVAQQAYVSDVLALVYLHEVFPFLKRNGNTHWGRRGARFPDFARPGISTLGGGERAARAGGPRVHDRAGGRAIAATGAAMAA